MSFADSNAFSIAIVASGVTLPAWYPPAQLQWVQIAGTNLQVADYSAQALAGLCDPQFSPVLDPRNNTYTFGDPKRNILDYSGGTLRTVGSELLLFGGGGPAAYAGNEIRGLMLESGNALPVWRTRKNPSNWANTWPYPDATAHAYMQDGITPNARHSYWSPIFHDGADRFLSFGSLNPYEHDGSPANNLVCDSWTWNADPASAFDLPGSVATLPNARGWDGSWCCKHPTTEKIYIASATKIQEWDEATNTYAIKYTNALTDLDRRMAAIDPVNSILLTIGQDNGVQHVGNAFDMTTTPFTKHAITWSGSAAAIAKTGAVASGWNWAAGFVYCPDLACFLLYNDTGIVYTITRVTDTNYAVEPLAMTGTPPAVGAGYGSAGANSILWGRVQYVPNLHGVVMLLNATSDVWFFRTL